MYLVGKQSTSVFLSPRNMIQRAYQYIVCSSLLEIRHYDAQSSPIGQYIVIYFLLPYIIYAHLMDRISILSLIVGQQTRYSLFLVLRISCILRTVLIINLCQYLLLLVSVYIPSKKNVPLGGSCASQRHIVKNVPPGGTLILNSKKMKIQFSFFWNFIVDFLGIYGHY